LNPNKGGVKEMATKTKVSGEEYFAKITRFAKMAGCRVARLARPLAGTSDFRRDVVLIEGKKYKVYHPQYLRKIEDRRYCYGCISKNSLVKVAGIIIAVEVEGFPERIFIVPTAEIIDAYGYQEGKNFYFYIPLVGRGPHSHTGRLDWWKYEQAWPEGDLVSAKKEEKSAGK
jgi:hypothetical protein